MDSLQSLSERIGRSRWETSARSQEGRGRRVDEEALDQATASHHRGAYAEAESRLEAEPNLVNDARGLVLLGLTRFALDEYETALEAMDQALVLASEDVAKIEVNRANLLALRERYDEALSATARARQAAPHLWTPLMQEMAVLERRDRPGDRERVIELARTVVRQWPDWKERDIARYLALDIDHAWLRLADDGRLFRSLFDVDPADLAARFTPTV